ncbi:unnamed protein product [Prorocentrum cordatum]|uniref:Mitochondrial carrier protein n=1 Tax=Prorocentrum cordatum TaxID=2364126 RepID=A0ABN9Q6S9_9DINO|nr:unnamed protein product [Polarella glacialis]
MAPACRGRARWAGRRARRPWPVGAPRQAKAKLGAALAAKKGTLLAAKKAAATLKALMQNPARLFKRRVFSPFEVLRGHSAGGPLGALRHELATGRGARGLSWDLLAPWATNCAVAVCMFHTYGTVSSALRRLGGRWEEASVAREAAAGAAAGAVQGALSTPLYNAKLRAPGAPLAAPGGAHAGTDPSGRPRSFAAAVAALRPGGVRGAFRNLPYVVGQEMFSMSAFFASNEWLKTRATSATRAHIDPSGKKDMIAWAAAASAAGVVLAAVSTPLENVLVWHVARRTQESPAGVAAHFLHGAGTRTRWRVLVSGLARKLPMAPVAGLPLLAYQVMLHSGLSPVLHEPD